MITLKHAFQTVMKTNIKILKSRLRDDTDDKSTISSMPNQNKNIGDICIKRSENKASVAMDRNGWHSHVNKQTQLKSESSKHKLDGNSIFHGKKFEPPNVSMRHLHKSISRKEMPESSQDNKRISFHPTPGSRRSTHKEEDTFGRLPEMPFWTSIHIIRLTVSQEMTYNLMKTFIMKDKQLGRLLKTGVFRRNYM